MKFLVDALLPPARARLPGELGQEAVAVRDVNLRQAEDGPIWQYALEHGTVIVTKDEDFPERSLRSPAPPQILWLRIGNCSNRALFAWFRPLWPEIERRPLAGDRIVEVSFPLVPKVGAALWERRRVPETPFPFTAGQPCVRGLGAPVRGRCDGAVPDRAGGDGVDDDGWFFGGRDARARFTRRAVGKAR